VCLLSGALTHTAVRCSRLSAAVCGSAHRNQSSYLCRCACALKSWEIAAPAACKTPFARADPPDLTEARFVYFCTKISTRLKSQPRMSGHTRGTETRRTQKPNRTLGRTGRNPGEDTREQATNDERTRTQTRKHIRRHTPAQKTNHGHAPGSQPHTRTPCYTK
jgi:hypothetical protein